MSFDKHKREYPEGDNAKRKWDDHQKAVIVMAVMKRQIEEAESVSHFLSLIYKLSHFARVPVIKLAFIYQDNFVNAKRGYFDVHYDRAGESINFDDMDDLKGYRPGNENV